MHKDRSIIILCGGDINYDNLPIGTNLSNAMVPINGRPVIGWILDSLIEKGIQNIIIVLQPKNTQLHKFLKWAFSDRLNMTFAFSERRSIVDSLNEGIKHSKTDTVGVLLGDTLIKDEFLQEEDYLFVGDYDASENWCLADINSEGHINAYYDQEKNVSSLDLRALAGYYQFSNKSVLSQAVEQVLSQEAIENLTLSKVLIEYSKKTPLKAIESKKWLDFGHINRFLEAKRELLQSRYFNTLTIDSVKGTITKKSLKTEKLQHELDWYTEIPDELRVLTPRILHARFLDNETFCIEQEYYGYPNLAELYLYGNLDTEIWHSIIDKLFEVYNLFTRQKKVCKPENATTMYWKKTNQRLDELKTIDFWHQLMSHETIVINGKEQLNINPLLDLLKEPINALSHTVQGCVIHGDYCFNNILYDVTSQVVRLIDPRGSFGEKGIVGDPRYDIAKLRHSICGLYDFIIGDLFSIQQEGDNAFSYQFMPLDSLDHLTQHFSKTVAKNGYINSEIELIEALLFISMIPYHEGAFHRQKMMYLRGIELLNTLI